MFGVVKGVLFVCTGGVHGMQEDLSKVQNDAFLL